MPTTGTDSTDEVLTCPKCHGTAMVIHLEENEVQKVRCASCHRLVAYTSDLIRIL